MLKSLWHKYWPLLVLIAAPLVIFAPLLLGRVWYWGVPLFQFYPWQRLAAELYRAGQLPLWNSLLGSGAPLAANLQTGAFYPLTFLHLLLPTEYAMGYTAFLAWFGQQNGGWCNDQFTKFMNLCGTTSYCSWDYGTVYPGGVDVLLGSEVDEDLP